MILMEILSKRFRMELAPIATADGLYSALRLHPTVGRVRLGIASGEISEESITQFVNAATADFRKGVTFPHEVELAALCTALATVPTPFAERFLKELSTVTVTEMPLSPKVATLSLRDHLVRFARNDSHGTLVFNRAMQSAMRDWTGFRVSTPGIPETRHAA